jgi:hypothetical protein
VEVVLDEDAVQLLDPLSLDEALPVRIDVRQDAAINDGR